MQEQVSIILTILSALLTGGFLMIFIESQHISNSVFERLNFIMRPFYHSLSSYVKFMTLYGDCFSFENVEKDTYMWKLKKDMEYISILGSMTILDGHDFPVDYFLAKDLERICNKINNVWYCIDNDYAGFNKIKYDESQAYNFASHINEYLSEISPKYQGKSLDRNLLSEVSGFFYANIYLQIENVLPDYERWQRKEKSFKFITICIIFMIIVTMMTILFLRSYIPLNYFNFACFVCSFMLIFQLYNLIDLEGDAKTVMR